MTPHGSEMLESVGELKFAPLRHFSDDLMCSHCPINNGFGCKMSPPTLVDVGIQNQDALLNSLVGSASV